MKTNRVLPILATFVLALSTSLAAQTPTEQQAKPATDTTAPMESNADRTTTQQEAPPTNRDAQPLTDQGNNTALDSSSHSVGTLSNPEANPNMINPKSNNSAVTQTTGTTSTTTTTTTDTTGTTGLNDAKVADPTLTTTTTTTNDTTGTTNLDESGLPQTASPLPLLALLAFGAAGAAFGLRKAQQQR